MANEVYIDTRLGGVAEVEKDIAKIENQLSKLTARMEKFRETGGDKNSRTYKGMQYDYEILQTRLEELNAELQNFNSNNAMTKQAEQTEKYSKACERASKKVASIGKSVEKNTKSFGIGIKGILKYAFGIRSLFVLINKLRSALVEGFKNLAQFNDGVNPVNEAISRLKSSLTQLKNSFAAAFAPILQIVEPILTRIISLISSVMTSIGQLIASITGAKTFTRAIAVQEDYAKSLNGTAKSAKNAQKQLAGFDKLNVINSKENNGSAGTVSPNKMFETVEIEGKIARIGERIRELAGTVMTALNPIKKFFMEEVVPRFLIIGQQVLEGFGKAVAFVSPYLKDFYDRVLEPIGEFAGKLLLEFLDNASKMISNVQKVFEEKGGKIGNILETLTNIAELLWLDGFKPALEFISGALGTFMDYVDDVIGDVIDIFDGLSDFLMGVFTGDWEKAWNGIKKIFFGVWNAILDIYAAVVNGIIDGLNKMSFELPSWMPKPYGGQKFGFNLERLDVSSLKIPALASGTVVPRSSDEFLAKLGDNNRETEVVSPLSTMKQAFLEAMRDSGMQGNSEIISLLRIIASKELIVPTDDVFTAMQNKAYEFRMANGTDAFL